MLKGILFTFDHCTKCEMVREAIKQKKLDIKIFTYPNDYSKWDEGNHLFADTMGVKQELLDSKVPLLVLVDKTKIYGQLRILRWIQNER